MKNLKDLRNEDLKENYYGNDYYGYCLSKVNRNFFRVYLSRVFSTNDKVKHATGTTCKNESILFDTVNEANAFIEDNKGISSFLGYEVERIFLRIKK